MSALVFQTWEINADISYFCTWILLYPAEFILQLRNSGTIGNTL